MASPKKALHQLTDHTKLLQKAVLVVGDKALLLKRHAKAHSRPNCWDLPGGNSEWPVDKESRGGLHRDDLAREIEEETGIAADLSGLDCNSMVYFDTYFEAEKEMYTVIANWMLELPENFPLDAIQVSREHSDFAWADLTELENYDFGGEKGRFVKESIETALAVAASEKEEGGCCGGDGCGGNCHH